VAGGTTNLASIPFIREYNAALLEFGASAVSEGSAKPEVDMQFERDDAPVRKIAAWVQATEEILSDAPTLRSYIDARLEYMLLLREEWELLNGSGTAPHLKGILQQTGLQTANSTAGDNLQGIANGAEKVELADGEADSVAMHPTAFWDIATRRTSTAGVLDVNPFTSPDNLRPWGLNVVRTRTLAATNAIVGSWRMGAQIFDKQGVVVRVGDQHSDYFIKNLLVVLAEERLAFAVYRPDWFVSVTLS
jgi:HK97 family phage major capsid protein